MLRTPTGADVVIADATPGPVVRDHAPALDPASRATPRRARARATCGRAPSPTSTVSATASASGVDGALPLTAEITAAALDALALLPGRPVHAAVKATDIEVYPA